MRYPEYDSPFEFVMSDIATQMAEKIDEMSWQAVQKVGINVDKEKLLIALKQDAERYREAFYRGKDTGYTERDEEIIRCNDCKHYDGDENSRLGTCLENGVCSTPDWFCADGERRIDDA